MGSEGKHLADTFEGFFSFALLDEADNRVDYCHPNNYTGVNPLTQKSLRHTGDKQNVNQDVIKVFEKPLQRALFGRGWEPIGADGFEALGPLGAREAVALAPQPAQDFVRFQGVRVGHAWGYVRWEIDRSARRLSHDFPSFPVRHPGG
jgi:hypothetical protein